MDKIRLDFITMKANPKSIKAGASYIFEAALPNIPGKCIMHVKSVSGEEEYIPAPGGICTYSTSKERGSILVSAIIVTKDNEVETKKLVLRREAL